MRSVIVSLSLLVLICGSLIWYSFTVKSISNELLDDIKEVESFVYEENWEKAKTAVKSFENTLIKNGMILSAIIDHQSLDTIILTHSRLGVYLEEQEKKDVLAELYSLQYLVGCIYTTNHINFENIF